MVSAPAFASGMTVAPMIKPADGLRLGAGLFALLLLAGCGRREDPDLSAIPHTPIPKTEARLTLLARDGALRYQGVVADEATRNRVADALTGATAGAASGTLHIDPDTLPPPWMAGLGPLSAALKQSGGQLELQGRRIELDGELSQENRATLLRQARRHYPGFTLAGLFHGVDMRHALPDEGDLEGLLAFLNAIPIEFQANSALLLPFSVEGLGRGARAIRATGQIARLQLRVYPDREGESRDALARQRAEAIATQLALRGIGPDRVEAAVAQPTGEGQAGTVEFVAAPLPAGVNPEGPAAATELEIELDTDATAAEAVD